MTFGSLFTGIGGIDLGLERAGMECLWQVENDQDCIKNLKRHWPKVKRYGDIRTIRGTDLDPIDLIAGGFPCQDLSHAGKRTGIEGTRSGLWFEFARLVGELGPRYVLIENVPGLLVHDAMRRVIGELARLGYVGCWRSLRAAEFGASHLRKRVFIVADGFSPRLEERRCIRSDDAEERASAERDCGTLPAFAPGPADPRWPAILAARPDLAPALESPLRRVADGVPDWLDGAMQDRTRRLRRLGNAVVPQIAEWIGLRIIEAHERRVA